MGPKSNAIDNASFVVSGVKDFDADAACVCVCVYVRNGRMKQNMRQDANAKNINYKDIKPKSRIIHVIRHKVSRKW